ncbi:hypothetical protein [Croceicoccus naphthovorans]|uniref:hypothetical protein n=1 Tax=Croceicoccus naphthovorans TaxID=1348774 RepID=UPI0012E063F7|nr:hypothetical protein [Croceicoccus naphthovorans]
MNGSEDEVALDVRALARPLEVEDGDAVAGGNAQRLAGAAEASPSAVQHSTNSAGLSSEQPSTWNTFLMWSAWTKAESLGNVG